MPKKSLTRVQIEEIVTLRKTGHSLPEIRKISGRATGSVFKYVKGIEVLPEYREVLRVKQGGSKERARKKWLVAKEKASTILNGLSERDMLIFLVGIYWGEGSKNEFNLINGDPYLVRAFLKSLYLLGINKSEIKFNFRLFLGMDKTEITDFWVEFLKIDRNQIGGYEIVKGNGSRKLAYGMCRVRVVKAAPYFKLVMSMIDFVKTNSSLS